MLQVERSEFETHLGAMFGAWNRVLSSDAKEGYWRGCESMSLSDFMRSVDLVVKRLQGDPELPLPNVGALWSVRRGLRARAPVVETSTGEIFDGWDIAANNHLMAYLRARGGPKRYHPDSTMVRHADGSYEAVPGHMGTERTMCLVRAKNRWAQTMRSVRARIAPEDQRGIWANEMAQAEREIDALVGT